MKKQLFLEEETIKEETIKNYPQLKFEVIRENNEEALRNFQEKFARVSRTLFWTRDLWNFPRITQKLISRYYEAGTIDGRLFQERRKHKSQGYQFFKEQYS